MVCVGPVRKPHCLFSHEAAHLDIAWHGGLYIHLIRSITRLTKFYEIFDHIYNANSNSVLDLEGLVGFTQNTSGAQIISN